LEHLFSIKRLEQRESKLFKGPTLKPEKITIQKGEEGGEDLGFNLELQTLVAESKSMTTERS